jgi:hypothetical protein
MNDNASARAVEAPATTAHRARRNGRWFFFGAALAMLAAVLAGFSSSFYLKGIVVSRAPAPPLAAYQVAHGVVMTAWYLLFAVQTLLVATERTARHRRLGTFGVALAPAVVLTGGYVSLTFPAHATGMGVPPDQMPAVLGTAIANLVLLAWFSAFVAAAVLLRRRREWHARLMFWSFFITLTPAFANGPGNGARLLGPLAETYLPGWPVAPILFAAAWAGLLALDWRTRRRIHPATLVCPVLVLAGVATIIAAVTALNTPATLEVFLRLG